MDILKLTGYDKIYPGVHKKQAAVMSDPISNYLRKQMVLCVRSLRTGGGQNLACGIKKGEREL